MPGSTHTDVGQDRWQLTDSVVRLRQWATDVCHDLPETSAAPLIIGSSTDCWLQVASDRASRAHAYLRRESGGWILRDAGSKNGILVGGRRREDDIKLEPGIEFLIGGITLMAESTRSIALRIFLGRILGWGREQIKAVDLGLRAVHDAVACQSALVLHGEDDLIPAARALHRIALGPDRPFIVCDRRGHRSDETLQAAENYKYGLQAIIAAKQGSLCVRSNHLPSDYAATKTALADKDTRVQLIVCATKPNEVERFGVSPIVVPPLSHRQGELRQIISEYATDVTAELSLPRSSFGDADEEWILANAASSLAEIETTIARILVIRDSDGVLNRAAARLGMVRWSLAKWVGRRATLPVPTDDSAK